MKIEDLFISYELALLARENGFNEETVAYFVGKDKRVYLGSKDVLPPFTFAIDSKTCFKAPTYDQLIEWFFWNKQIGIEIALDETLMWVYRLTPLAEDSYLSQGEQSFYVYSTRREALIKAIEHLFDLLNIDK